MTSLFIQGNPGLAARSARRYLALLSLVRAMTSRASLRLYLIYPASRGWADVTALAQNSSCNKGAVDKSLAPRSLLGEHLAGFWNTYLGRFAPYLERP